MPRCLLHVASDSAAIDLSTNRLSIFHIIEEINSPAFPTLVPTLTIVTLIEKEDGDNDNIGVRILAMLNGSQISEFPVTIAPTCSRIAVRKLASPASKPLAAITRPAISSVLSSSPAAVRSTPRQSRDNSFRAKYRLRR